MKNRLSITILVVALVALGCGCGKSEKPPTSTGGPTSPVTRAEPTKILMAASSALKIEPPFQVAVDPAAAGGKYVVSPKDPKADKSAKNRPCVASYEFTVSKPDTYFLWIRKNWEGGCSNSLFVKLDDQPEFIFGEDGTYERWDWTNAIGKSFNLKAGKHSLLIKNREDGSKFDQILFVADKDYVPVGIEGQ
jgi:hypothetical protein